ncbi:MAG: hypothetical protein IT443_07405 [Phycisphaeraceae bacterium]|nr:hypothetical protein [Phycisphaeraceae bacterium]
MTTNTKPEMRWVDFICSAPADLGLMRLSDELSQIARDQGEPIEVLIADALTLYLHLTDDKRRTQARDARLLSADESSDFTPITPKF